MQGWLCSLVMQQDSIDWSWTVEEADYFYSESVSTRWLRKKVRQSNEYDGQCQPTWVLQIQLSIQYITPIIIQNPHMQINRYISIPTLESTTSGTHNYLTYTELLLSVLTGILLICFTQINQLVVTESEFQVLYLFSALALAKIVIPINYMCRTKAPKTRLQTQAKVDIGTLFIPSFIKSLLYLGFLMLLTYIGWLLVILPMVVCVVGVQLLWIWVQSKKKIAVIYELKNSKDYQELKKRQKRNATNSCVSLREICIQILLVVAFILHVDYFQVVYNIETVIAICFSGCMCLLAFYYMHHQIFQLYHSDVDELLAKQYPIELFNFLLYCLIYYFLNNKLGTVNTGNLAITGKVESSPGFLFVLQYPIHTTVGVCFSILYEYLSMEVIKKSSFKCLFLTQLTGIFWFNLYSFKSGVTTSKYFSTFIAFFALLMLTRLIQAKAIYIRVIRIKKWFRRKNKKMVEQLEHAK